MNLRELRKLYQDATINPLGDWTGGTDVDTGATNRKLGSDMALSVSGGGINGKAVEEYLIKNNKAEKISLGIVSMTKDERDILLSGGLINYYSKK